MGKIPLLLLRLEGPLQSWGLRSRWDVRDTGDEPSKSGIVGLLGCALGYPMYAPRLEELDGQLTMAVRVEHSGRRLVDYQTVTGLLPTAGGEVKGTTEDPGTIVSPRAYLQDAAFLAILAGPLEVLECCRDALANPHWPVYLGRKSCPPSRPVCAGLVTEYDSLEDALRRHPWDWHGRATNRKAPEGLWCVLESSDGTALRADRVQANPARMYGTRGVREFRVPFPGAVVDSEGKEGGGPCSSRA